MIIHIDPIAGLEKIVFTAESIIEADFECAAWQAIRPGVEHMEELLDKFHRDVSVR